MTASENQIVVYQPNETVRAVQAFIRDRGLAEIANQRKDDAE